MTYVAVAHRLHKPLLQKQFQLIKKPAVAKPLRVILCPLPLFFRVQAERLSISLLRR